MRLDKWLQLSRLAKRRSLAKELCLAGRVRLNGRAAKPGIEVALGDLVALDYGDQPTIELRVADVPGRGTLSRAAAAQLYVRLPGERGVQADAAVAAPPEGDTAQPEPPAAPHGAGLH